MRQHASGTCLQYTDDTNLNYHITVKDIYICLKRVNGDLVSIKFWSSNTNLIYNSTKTKILLFSTKQMSRLHNKLGDLYTLKPGDVLLEIVSSYQALGTPSWRTCHGMSMSVYQLEMLIYLLITWDSSSDLLHFTWERALPKVWFLVSWIMQTIFSIICRSIFKTRCRK